MKWKLTEEEYIYDDTVNGLLSVIYHLILKKEVPRIITIDSLYQDNLFNSPIFIKTNLKNSNKLLDKIKSISKQAVYFIFTAFKSNNMNKEIIILKYIICILKYGNKINYMKNKETIIEMSNLIKQVNLEIHRFNGFLRFDSLNDDILYAKFSPDNNIIENVAYTFKQKFGEETWIIHDEKRNIVAFYDNKKLQFYYNIDFELKDLKHDEYGMLWKEYFKRISIKERENKRCQKNFMPKRYWHNMLEVKEDL